MGLMDKIKDKVTNEDSQNTHSNADDDYSQGVNTRQTRSSKNRSNLDDTNANFNDEDFEYNASTQQRSSRNRNNMMDTMSNQQEAGLSSSRNKSGGQNRNNMMDTISNEDAAQYERDAGTGGGGIGLYGGAGEDRTARENMMNNVAGEHDHGLSRNSDRLL